ncbi:MAG: sensor histidine kinase [Pyrinomonadaceae bacterium]
MDFFNTFRGRLLVILALLLIVTLGVQFYLNLKTQNENERLRELQEQTIVAGIALGVSGITSSEYMQDLIDQPGQTYLDADARERIRDIIIINNKWQITDSLNPDLVPTTADDGTDVFKNLSEVSDLPPLMEGSRLGTDIENFPNRQTSEATTDDEAHAVSIDTSKGRYYIMVLLKNDRRAAAWRAAQPLVYTLGIVLASTLITFLLVWRFTRPIANLSNAAQDVASGNLAVRVQDHNRADEIGQLAQNFNEMVAELEKTRELEDQLRQAEKSAVVGRLGSAIAHEIRNPLNYINLTLDHLKNKFSPADGKTVEYQKLIGQIKTEVARINQQISDFLNYSRPAKAHLQPVEARKVVEDSLRLVEAQAAENNIKIGVVEHEDVGQIMGDTEFLRSVFNNLFINAVQAMGTDGGHLSVKISPEAAFVRFEVSDTGSGISEENLSKIFEPYFSTKETGTGLGLAIVQKIVDIHNGDIAVESTLGKGTKFTVRIPRA